jgi:subtilisin family serine protease
MALNGDPLLPNQWHIQNTGQNAFSTTPPVAGNDMNVTGAWTAGYSGKGIKVGVVDSGLEAAHEDLAANVDLTHSWNFITGTNDPTRQVTDVGEDHGTQVAGIIGAVAFNGKGGRGVAYNATLRGYNLIAAGAFSVANMAKAMGSDPISADNDLFNASFESSQGFSLPTFSGAYQAITGTALTLRSNLGAAIVNAGGNDFAFWSGGPAGQCAAANQFGVGCGDTAGDERRGGYAPIIVAALNANGVHATYSNTGILGVDLGSWRRVRW